MAQLTPTQRYLRDSLTRDLSSNHTLLSGYLKLILAGRALELTIPPSNEIVRLTTTELWNEIIAWRDENNVNLVMGDRGSIRTLASRLLSNLEKTQDAFRTATIVQESIKITTPIRTTSTIPKTRDLAHFLEERRKTLDLYNKRVLGLSNILQSQSDLLRKIPDANTRVMVANLLANNAANLRNEQLDKLTVADEVYRLAMQSAGRNQILPSARLFYSDIAQEKEIQQLQSLVNSFITKAYPEKDDFNNSSKEISALTHSLSIEDVPTLINLVASDLPMEEQQALGQALRLTIIDSLGDPYLTGEDLLSSALRRSGLSTTNAAAISSISPYLEEIRAVEQEPFFVGDFNESDSRLLHVKNLAATIGVSPKVIWYESSDIAYQKSVLEKKYGVNLEQALANETSDYVKISEIKAYLSNRDQYAYYHQNVDGTFLYYWREKIGKVKGNISGSSIGRFSTKIGKKIKEVDGFLLSPFRFITETIEKGKEKNVLWNIFTPGQYIGRKLSEFQIGIALWLYKKTAKVARGTGATAWFARQIAQCSHIFYKSGGDWQHTSFHFIQSKWGNILDWSVKTISSGKHATVKDWRFAIANVAWGAFTKASPELAAKFAANGLMKMIIGVIGGEMTMGVSLAIQLGWEAISFAFRKVKQFFNDPVWRDKFISNLPVYAAIGSIISGVVALPTIIIGAIGTIGAALLAGLGAAASSLLAIFLLGGALTLGFSLGSPVLYGLFDTTIKLDSGSSLAQNVANIVCSLTGSGAPGSSSNPRLAAGKCVYELLSKAGINPLVRGNATGPGFTAFSTGLGNGAAAAEAQYSATNYGSFQCSGFDSVVDLMTGGSGGFGDAHNLDTIRPSGYRYVAGVDSCAPGDFFVDKNGTWGHTGLFVEVAGANIICLDANSDGNGLVRDENTCRWPTSAIAGCLKSN